MIIRKARKSWSVLAVAVVVAGGVAAAVSLAKTEGNAAEAGNNRSAASVSAAKAGSNRSAPSGSAAKAESNPSAPPVMTLGTYQAAEDSSPDFIPIPGSGHPNVANTYLAWGQGLPTTFMNSAYSQGATPYVEIEPWHQGPSWNATPSFSAIASNGDASDTNCSLDGSTYATSCATWLADLGQAIASFGHPVVLTFAHEFNVDGQYPWSEGDTGSCGSASCTPAQWIAAWDEVQSIIDANAGGNAFWLWAPNADTGGSTTDPAPWWPGSSSVDLVGVDGYPDTQYGSQFGTFSGEFGQTFTEIRNLGYTGGIFISETNLAALDGSGYETIPQFVSDLCAAGGTGFLEWEDGGAPAMTSTQWNEANTALANDCSGGGGTGGGGGGGGGGGTWSCTTSANNGACPSSGNYNGSLTGAAQQVTEDVQDVSNPSSALNGQTLQANSASDWQVTANIAAGNTAFISFPQVQDTLTNTSGHPVPLAGYSSLTTSYASTLPSAGSSDDWAAGYAIWLGNSTSSYAQQVNVWTANHGQVPSGSDINQVWTDPASGAKYEMWVNWNSGVITLVPKVNSTSGSFSIYDLVEYLTQNGFSEETGISQVAYGFVLASTSGANETFAVSNFTLAGTGDGENGAPGT